MKRSTFFAFLTVLALILLLTAAGGFYWIISHSPLHLLQNNQVVAPSAARFVPKQAPLMVSLLKNPDKLEAFHLIETPVAERRQEIAEFNQIAANLLANSGIDYGRDIRPWLGDEITFAVTTKDIDRNSENGKQIGILIGLATENSPSSRHFLDSFWKKQAVEPENLVVESYKGVKLIYSNAPETSPSPKWGNFATGVVGDRFVLLANHPKVLRDAINNAQLPRLSLISSPNYQEVLQQLKQRQLGLTYVNLGEFNAAFNDVNEVEYSPSILGIGLELDPQGLLAQTSLLTENANKNLIIPTFSEPVKAGQYLPVSSALAIGSRNLSQFSDRLWAGIKSGNPFANLLAQSLSKLEEEWGIQLQADIFNVVKGEYALALLPSAEGNQQNWIFVAEKSPETDAAFDRLDAIAEERGYKLTPLNLENQKVSVWTKLITTEQGNIQLKAKVGGVHTRLENYEIFATSVHAMDEALKAPQNSLFDSKKLQASIARISTPNQGYLYLNWPSSQNFLESQLPILKVVNSLGEPLLENLRSLTLTTYISEDNVNKGSAFVRLASGEKREKGI